MLFPVPGRWWVAVALGLGLLVAGGCQQADEPSGEPPGFRWIDWEPLVPMEEGPTYHLLEGYDPVWLDQVRTGVEKARAYWGSYGPAHVWVLGKEEGDAITEGARRAFLEEYCTWRTATSERSVAECLTFARQRLLKPAENGEAEAYLSDVRDTDPRMAELIFINVHKWFFERDVIPDPVLRGIHEYTHVFQQSVAPMPTWMAEGGAVFAEAWLPWLDAGQDPKGRMRHSMRSARRVRDPEVSIADMEEIESAPPRVAKYYRELAYDAGAWATAFLVHRSRTRSVSGLRDEFFPLVKKHGWEIALPGYIGMKSKADFYAAFAVFMKLPMKEQLLLIDELKP